MNKKYYLAFLLLFLVILSFSPVMAGDKSFNVPIIGESPACSPKICKKWQCLDADLEGTGKQTCDIYECEKWNGDECEVFSCTKLGIPGGNDFKACFQYKCNETGVKYCSRWDCDLTEKTVGYGKDTDTCAEWFCSQRSSEGLCKEWWCKDIDIPGKDDDACSLWECTNQESNWCRKWQCSQDSGHNSCSSWKCILSEGSTCIGWNCTEENVPGSDQNTCSSWQCEQWADVGLGEGCECSDTSECASGCCSDGICTNALGEPDLSRDICFCQGFIWKEGKCCGDDVDEEWCGSTGLCTGGKWISVEDADTNKDFCEECIGKKWLDNLCCGDDESDNFCSESGRCLGGELLDVCSFCEDCDTGDCVLNCNLDTCSEDVDSRCEPTPAITEQIIITQAPTATITVRSAPTLVPTPKQGIESTPVPEIKPETTPPPPKKMFSQFDTNMMVVVALVVCLLLVSYTFISKKKKETKERKLSQIEKIIDVAPPEVLPVSDTEFNKILETDFFPEIKRDEIPVKYECKFCGSVNYSPASVCYFCHMPLH